MMELLELTYQLQAKFGLGSHRERPIHEQLLFQILRPEEVIASLVQAPLLNTPPYQPNLINEPSRMVTGPCSDGSTTAKKKKDDVRYSLMYIFSAESAANGTSERIFLGERNVAYQRGVSVSGKSLMALEGDLPTCLICTRVGSHLAPAPIEANT
jgi:hypothetical protein